MNDFLTVFDSPTIIGGAQIAACLMLSFVLTMLLSAVYRWTHAGLSYSRSFVQTLILGGMTTCMLIMAIGNNLARGLGILGTLAIVRFRTPIRDPRDMIFLFAALGVGIACGAYTFSVALFGTLAISAAALFLHFSPFASRREFEALLRFSLERGPEESEESDGIREILQCYCSAFSVVAMREAGQGDITEFSYHVRLIDPTYQSDLLAALHEHKGVSDANLIMHRTTVEL